MQRFGLMACGAVSGMLGGLLGWIAFVWAHQDVAPLDSFDRNLFLLFALWGGASVGGKLGFTYYSTGWDRRSPLPMAAVTAVGMGVLALLLGLPIPIEIAIIGGLAAVFSHYVFRGAVALLIERLTAEQPLTEHPNYEVD